MALTHNNFLKITPITVDAGEVAAGLATRTYNTRIEDLTTISVYYNGQLIPGGEVPVTPDSRFYYTIDTTLTPPTVDLGLGSVPTDTSTAVFTLNVNTDYRGPGYSGSGGFPAAMSTTDSFVISYYYVIYTVAA